MKIRILINFLICLFIIACISFKQPNMRIDYYTLEYAPKKIDKLEPLLCVLRLERFKVSPHYNSNNIIYREKEFERNAYDYHKWRVNPGDLITYFLARDLKQSNLFKAVFTSDNQTISSYSLEGLIDEFYEYDGEKNWEAVLALQITLIKENEHDITKRVCFQKNYSLNKKLEKKNPQFLAKAMSMALQDISNKIINDVYTYIKNLKG